MKKKKKVLITGVTGLLGKALAETNGAGHQLVGTYLPKTLAVPFYNFPTTSLDVRDREKLLSIFQEHRPEVVIHTASIGSVDYCETHREESWEVNVKGTQNIIHFCEEFGAKLIFISSNAVFDGEKAPYGENDPVHPINYYGKLKVEGEECTRKARVPHAIVRPILMYGWHHPSGRPNPVTWQIDMMEKGQKVKMVTDIYCNPLYSINCAEAIWAVVDKNKEGLYHVAGKNNCSRYEFAEVVADVFHLNKKLLEPVANAFFKEIAPRPRDTSYRVDKMEKELGVKALSAREGLEAMKKQKKAGS